VQEALVELVVRITKVQRVLLVAYLRLKEVASYCLHMVEVVQGQLMALEMEEEEVVAPAMLVLLLRGELTGLAATPPFKEVQVEMLWVGMGAEEFLVLGLVTPSMEEAMVLKDKRQEVTLEVALYIALEEVVVEEVDQVVAVLEALGAALL
tara:strand:- start:157 stop:609 length:453 start_codon:yes stop_codon:yes gene_type:complete